MTRVFIGIGSNVQREKNIAEGLATLQQTFGELLSSSIYESAPVGFSGDAFFNLVTSFNSDDDALTIAKQLRTIEFAHGRTADSKKFNPRTLDLDLLLFGDDIINADSLQIPRKDIEVYAFVLEPLAEIAPSLKHPVLHKTYAQLWAEMPKNNVKQTRIGLFSALHTTKKGYKFGL